MKYAILGDIHANLEALQAVLEDARMEGVTNYACVGDVVGYASNPRECMALIRELNCPTVKGNHDEYASVDDECENFRAIAADAIKWTRTQLSEEERQWLKELKMVRYVESFTIVHATLDMPDKWGYVMDKLAAASNFSYQNTSVCFYGHTHSPMAFVRDGIVRGGLFEKLRIEPGKRYFINVGSVGQPRDGNPLAAYAIYDMDGGIVQLKRLPYDIKTAQSKIYAANLPEKCATRLEVGK
ncbi:MAG: metallophosphoesterase family protein [Verrucomicrobiae bacterium]|nr:metallophosphoesterase family protein [Verrucomicrobiae bacterium]